MEEQPKTPSATAETVAAHPAPNTDAVAPGADAPGPTGPEQPPGEIGGPPGPEPTRYGDWSFKGRCSDF